MWRSGRAPGSRSIRTSSIAPISKKPGSVSTLPRSMSSFSTPSRFSAVRCPATATSTAALCACTDRTFTFRREGRISTMESFRTLPEISVPVTTVPCPFSTNTRSTGSRKTPAEERCSRCRACSRNPFLNSSIPAPVFELTLKTGAPSRKLPRTSS